MPDNEQETKPENQNSTIPFYTCEHQQSNDPCPKCQPNDEPMPDDWQKTYQSPATTSGLDDKVATD